jgi:hypothetical protein
MKTLAKAAASSATGTALQLCSYQLSKAGSFGIASAFFS